MYSIDLFTCILLLDSFHIYLLVLYFFVKLIKSLLPDWILTLLDLVQNSLWCWCRQRNLFILESLGYSRFFCWWYRWMSNLVLIKCLDVLKLLSCSGWFYHSLTLFNIILKTFIIILLQILQILFDLLLNLIFLVLTWFDWSFI